MENGVRSYGKGGDGGPSGSSDVHGIGNSKEEAVGGDRDALLARISQLENQLNAMPLTNHSRIEVRQLLLSEAREKLKQRRTKLESFYEELYADRDNFEEYKFFHKKNNQLLLLVNEIQKETLAHFIKMKDKFFDAVDGCGNCHSCGYSVSDLTSCLRCGFEVSIDKLNESLEAITREASEADVVLERVKEKRKSEGSREASEADVVLERVKEKKNSLKVE